MPSTLSFLSCICVYIIVSYFIGFIRVLCEYPSSNTTIIWLHISTEPKDYCYFISSSLRSNQCCYICRCYCLDVYKMRNFLVGIQRFCNLGTKLNTIKGIRNLYSGWNYNPIHNNNVMSLKIMNLREPVPRGNFVLQGSSKLLQLVGSSNNAINYTFNGGITNMDVITQNRICDPSIQNNETLQLDSVLRKRRKKMKKHKLRKRRKREKALKRKISQGQKK